MSERKTILITGVTRGLGRALACRYASQGHTIVGCGRNQDALQSLRDELGSAHGFSAVDVVDDDAVATWAASVIEQFGAPDILLNNAALINERAPLWKVPRREFDQVIDVNIKGVVNVLRHFTPAMVARGSGVILNLSSGWGQFGAPDVAPYCATKFAIEGMTQAMAHELPAGMAAIPLSPGIIHTDMLDTAFGDAASEHWTPEAWIEVAAPFILNLGPQHNGQSIRIPDAA